jgi:hypothetical protein
LLSWIGAHVRAFEFYQGVPKLGASSYTYAEATGDEQLASSLMAFLIGWCTTRFESR